MNDRTQEGSQGYLNLIFAVLTSCTCRHQRVTCSSHGQAQGHGGSGQTRLGSERDLATEKMAEGSDSIKHRQMEQLRDPARHKWLTRKLPGLHCTCAPLSPERPEIQGWRSLWCVFQTRNGAFCQWQPGFVIIVTPWDRENKMCFNRSTHRNLLQLNLSVMGGMRHWFSGQLLVSLVSLSLSSSDRHCPVFKIYINF